MPSSSASSRVAVCSGDSPGSTTPPARQSCMPAKTALVVVRRPVTSPSASNTATSSSVTICCPPSASGSTQKHPKPLRFGCFHWWCKRRTCSPPLAPGSLLGPLEDLDEAPPLGRRQRSGLHQRHPVADAGGAVLVVRLHLGGGANDLAVERVLGALLELDHDGLLHLVAHHVADARLATAARLLGPRRVRRALLGGLLLSAAVCHYESSPTGPDARPNSRSRSTV